jgi:hypothetical protein
LCSHPDDLLLRPILDVGAILDGLGPLRARPLSGITQGEPRARERRLVLDVGSFWLTPDHFSAAMPDLATDGDPFEVNRTNPRSLII